MNKQRISLSKTRVSCIFALALPVGVLFLAQACSCRGPGCNVEAPASEMTQYIETHSLKK